MNSTANGYKELAHPSDLALHVWADSLSELFVQAGKGLCELLKPESTMENELFQTSIVCNAADTESLLVAFLSEILYCLNEQQILYVPFNARMEQNRISANLEGTRVSKPGREVKAATYSDLQVKKTRSGFETTIVFDI